MTNVMLKTHLTPWTAACWTAGSSASRWPGTAAHLLRTGAAAGVAEGLAPGQGRAVALAAAPGRALASAHTRAAALAPALTARAPAATRALAPSPGASQAANHALDPSEQGNGGARCVFWTVNLLIAIQKAQAGSVGGALCWGLAEPSRCGCGFGGRCLLLLPCCAVSAPQIRLMRKKSVLPFTIRPVGHFLRKFLDKPFHPF